MQKKLYKCINSYCVICDTIYLLNKNTVKEDLIAVGAEHQFQLVTETDRQACQVYGPPAFCFLVFSSDRQPRYPLEWKTWFQVVWTLMMSALNSFVIVSRHLSVFLCCYETTGAKGEGSIERCFPGCYTVARLKYNNHSQCSHRYTDTQHQTHRQTNHTNKQRVHFKTIQFSCVRSQWY